MPRVGANLPLATTSDGRALLDLLGRSALGATGRSELLKELNVGTCDLGKQTFRAFAASTASAGFVVLGPSDRGRSCEALFSLPAGAFRSASTTASRTPSRLRKIQALSPHQQFVAEIDDGRRNGFLLDHRQQQIGRHTSRFAARPSPTVSRTARSIGRSASASITRCPSASACMRRKLISVPTGRRWATRARRHHRYDGNAGRRLRFVPLVVAQHVCRGRGDRASILMRLDVAVG